MNTKMEEMSDDFIADAIETSVALFMAKTIIKLGEAVERESELHGIIHSPTERLTHQLAALALLADWKSACEWSERVIATKLGYLQKRN